jgi:tetratricopeptide (TPR) repeat protein
MEEFMKIVGKVLAGMSVLALMMSCSTGFEGKGDNAYKIAQRLQGEQKRYQQKMAYMMYDKAVKAKQDKITPKLRNRYVEMILIRAGMVLNEGAAQSEAIPLFIEDLDKYLTPDVSPELKQQYALFLVQLADTNVANEQYVKALATFDKAMSVANDKSAIESKKSQMLAKIAADNYGMAEAEFKIAKEDKDEEGFIKADYYTLVSMHYDSTNPKTKKLLSDIYKENKATYSAYVRVIEGYTDTAIFKGVNKWDILLAVPVLQQKGSSVTSIINIYNNSYNPLRMKASDFMLVNESGKEFPASQTRIEPEMLDQQHETKCKLTFSGVSGNIVKVIYRNGEHYTEKYMM